MQTALNNNDSFKAKELFEQHLCELKRRSQNEKDKRTQQMMMNSMNLLGQKVKEVKPDRNCSCKDFIKLFKGILLGINLMIGFTLKEVSTPGNGVITAVTEGIKTGLCRSHDGGNPLKTVTGALAGGTYGLNKGAITGVLV